MATEKAFEECRDALERVQTFDPATLGRSEELGTHMNFIEAIAPAQALIDIYRRIPISALSDFTDSQLGTIQGQANADFNLFTSILEFDPSSSDPSGNRRNLLSNIRNRRDDLFNVLWQYVAYGVARMTDTNLLETQARATIQGIADKASTLTAQLNQAKVDADSALAAIRATASEQGVSQEAFHFQAEAKLQEDLADKWLTYTYCFAGAFAIFAVLSVFLHKIPYIQPSNAFETFQLATSKVLIFTVFGYMLVLAARNYATHKHNAIVNRHRQNALLTYRALVEAAEGAGTQDIVLAHAASCIFSPQETGFSHGVAEANAGSKSVLELLTKNTTRE